jgi:hypothetical protein
VVIIVAALFTWHKIDKGSAVRKAIIGYVADVELSAERAENERLASILARERSANTKLQQQIDAAETTAASARERIRNYEEENPSPVGCRADAAFIERLRGVKK